MNPSLEPLRTPALTNMEAGQLLKRHLNDIGTLDPSLLTDAPFSAYVQVLSPKVSTYEKALARVQKSDETKKLELADDERDKALTAFNAALKLHAFSEIPEEAEASRSLGILYATLKNPAALNYEAETLAIDKLVSELLGPTYSPKINLLNMDRYVARLTSTNETFKNLFSGRMLSDAMTETFDLKSIRTDMFKTYSDFCNYVLAMAKALNTPLFVNTLNMLNTARKYYSDLLARRAGTKASPEKPIA